VGDGAEGVRGREIRGVLGLRNRVGEGGASGGEGVGALAVTVIWCRTCIHTPLEPRTLYMGSNLMQGVLIQLPSAATVQAVRCGQYCMCAICGQS
jgi:hypothetical protein